MRKLSALLCAMLLCLSACAALAETEITVSGSGQVLVPAESAIITLGVETVSTDVSEAQNTVNTTIAAIRAVLVEAGIPAEDITTDVISICALYSYEDDVPRVTAYNASSTLAIRVTDVDLAGTVIDLAFGAGANTLSGISFSAGDTTQAGQEALTAAVADARGRADIIAAAAGLRITGIRTISNSAVYSAGAPIMTFKRYETAAAEDSNAAPTVVQAARLTVETTVTIVFVAEPIE